MEKGLVTFKELKYYIIKDLGWTNGKVFRSFLNRYFFEAGFKFVFWLRLTRYFYLKKGIFFKILCSISRFILKHYSYKYQFDISYKTQIGAGLTIAHFGYIVIASNVIIGENCNLRLGVVVGKKLSKDTGGAIIGDNVSFGVGSKVVGDIKIGDNVTVGANAVITKDVPSNCIVAGVPSKVIGHIDSNK